MTGPAWDLAWVINAPWLLYAVAHVFFLQGVMPDVDNFRHYYITLPHRFITLGLVFLDRDQFLRRPRTFVGLPIGFLLLLLVLGSLGSGVFMGAQAFLCLYTIDLFWNAYHFAAQHYGITRIYGRKAGGGRPGLEKLVLVPAISWALLTTANWTVIEGPWRALFVVLDALAFGGLLLLVALELRDRVPSLPKLLYLSSVTLLYGGILLLPYLELNHLRLGLLASTGYFHSVEYLAIVSFYVRGKQRAGGFQSGPFRLAAPIWIQALLLYALFIGTMSLLAESLLPTFYVVMLTVGSFCHYSYDGMIWKLRRPNVSQALQAEVAT